MASKAVCNSRLQKMSGLKKKHLCRLSSRGDNFDTYQASQLAEVINTCMS